VNPLSDDTLPCLPPVIELDPSELVAEGGGIVTALDAVTAVARALPTSAKDDRIVDELALVARASDRARMLLARRTE
jgi:hypothetical protein